MIAIVGTTGDVGSRFAGVYVPTKVEVDARSRLLPQCGGTRRRPHLHCLYRDLPRKVGFLHGPARSGACNGVILISPLQRCATMPEHLRRHDINSAGVRAQSAGRTLRPTFCRKMNFSSLLRWPSADKSSLLDRRQPHGNQGDVRSEFLADFFGYNPWRHSLKIVLSVPNAAVGHARAGHDK